MKVSSLILAAASLVAAASSATMKRAGEEKKVMHRPANFENWRTFKANGVNLGGWLVQEKGMEPSFFNDNGASAANDENAFCKILGAERCGELLETRYKNFFKKRDIDRFAAYGVNLLRVPVGYWAFMDAADGYYYHHGEQTKYLSKLAQYAQEQYGMHVILDFHGLPGGHNGLDNQGSTGDIAWWYNTTYFDQTLDLVKLSTEYVLAQPHPEQWTLSLINEPLSKGPIFFGQTNEGVAYLNKFYRASLDIVREMDPEMVVPVMLSDGFAGPLMWEEWWGTNTENIVFDTHIYYFIGGSYGFAAQYDSCYSAKVWESHKQPVFIGEWSIQATMGNSADFDQRSLFYYSQWDAYNTYMSGGAFWNGKHMGTNVIGDDSTDQSYYWSFQKLASQGVIKKLGETYTAYTCESS
ncbi:uncharacterized protein JN550_008966 [Neoarthrinium moseri]|uniref:uncharacterized protein n=1 Tax=Neoarthrinium moseri TaxID=1658444 RepID=UPI001FDBC815|nr:uncharacterized protein JN550_008966 [Neoarthrinium moseri]KAI1864409.1 hypothetical protein JN550_008966 [Neoarthrinium moseri]